MPESLHEEAPLQAEGSQQQVDAHAAESISLQEGHEEAEADEDHDVDILKHCRDGRVGGVWGCWIELPWNGTTTEIFQHLAVFL